MEEGENPRRWNQEPWRTMDVGTAPRIKVESRNIQDSRTVAYPPKKRISVFSQKEESTMGHCFAPPILPLVNRNNNCGHFVPIFQLHIV